MNRMLAWAAAASLVLVACSSTQSPTADDPPTGLAPEVAPDDPSGAASPDVDAPAGTPGDEQGPATAPGTSPTGGATGATRSGTSPGAVDFGPPGQGVTPSAVTVGIWVLNTDATCNATGAAGRTGRGDCGDRSHVAEFEVLADWVNATGGVAGRTLEVVIHETLANNSSWVAQAESACEAFAEDHKVFLAISELQIGRPHFTRCMAERGIPVIDPGSWPWDATDYEDLFPYLYQPSRPRVDRGAKAYVNGLAARNFFDGDATVGLVRFDSPTHTRVAQNVLLPRLTAHGVDEVRQAVLRTPAGISGLGDMNAEMSNHILSFKNAGVNRVLFLTNHEVQFFFYTQADSQDFRPRYGLSSPEWLTLASDNAPGGQLDGAIAVGWAPGYDTPSHKDPGLDAAGRRCKRAFQAAGMEDAFAGRNIKCDTLFFLKQVLDRAPALNVEGLRAAVETLGRSFKPTGTFAARFKTGRYDGPSIWRPLAYRGACGCFVYTGGERPF